MVFRIYSYCIAYGHALASRLSKRITTVSKQLKKIISTYNEGVPENEQLTWQSANDLSLDQQLRQSQLAGAPDLPREVKHQAVRQLQLVKRSSEEITHLKREMTNCFHYYVDELQQLQAVRSELQVSATSMLELGSVCLINRRIFRCQRTLNELTSKFTSLIEVPLPFQILFLSPPPPIRYKVTKKSLVHPKQVKKNMMERGKSLFMNQMLLRSMFTQIYTLLMMKEVVKRQNC